ncbi:hypothetical protein CNR22_00625 [Sphingobacteriaceae bacterium]|nr:hypothetical protein CNR22_00625 [Sphingobacteriaceae bacterium]
MQNTPITLLNALEDCREQCIDFITENQTREEPFAIKCLDLCRDCEKLCEVTFMYVNRRSHYSKKILKLCSEVCHKCADELLKHFSPLAKDCIEMCRFCAQQCATAS